MSVASVELLRAAAYGDLNRLRALLAQGIDVNSRNQANQTALILAVAFKRLEIVKYLVLAGADVKLQDELGLTAADWARQDIRIIRLLDTPPTSATQEESVDQGTHAASVTPGGLAGAMLRDHTTNNSGFAAAVARETPVTAETVSVADDETDEETLKPLRPPMSPALRTLVRVSIVVLLVVGGFGAYHFVTSVLSNRTARSKPEPASTPATAAMNVTKTAPAIGGALVGAELFLPDAQYPPDATVASGNVTVGIQVSRKGVVVKAEALDGDESLRSAAEKAAWSSAFAPEKLIDKSELIDGTITYNFSKPNDSKPEIEVSDDADARRNVSATVAGPLAGAERKLVIPKIPKWVTVEQESATVVVRVTKSGRVMSFRPLDAEERLRPYLIRAARASTFDPSKLPSDGQVVGIITYKFQ